MPEAPRQTRTSESGQPAALSPAARVADGLVLAYQKALSPVLAAAFPTCGCRFHPTCSHYAREALREHGFLAGSALALRRLVRCGPWHPGGPDPVPPRRPVCTGPNSLITRQSSPF